MKAGSSVKVTYSLPEQLAEQVREVVGKGRAPSASAFVARVLREALLRERDALLAEEFRQAAADPDFLAACEEVERVPSASVHENDCLGELAS